MHELPDVVQFNRRLLPHLNALFPEVSETSEAPKWAKDQPLVFGRLLCCAADFYVHEQRDKLNAQRFLDLATRLCLDQGDNGRRVINTEAELAHSKMHRVLCF